jgi:hypothetical protein
MHARRGPPQTPVPPPGCLPRTPLKPLRCPLAVSQALWHLASFRQAVLALEPPPPPAKAPAAARPPPGGSPDAAVLRALTSVFHELAAPLPSAPRLNGSGGGGGGATGPVCPAPLREALSDPAAGGAAGAPRLALHEMHDASEVLLVLLSCMHRAEAAAGGGAAGPDPQLPRRVRLAAARAPAGKAATPASAVTPLASAGGVRAGYAAALAAGARLSAASGGSGSRLFVVGPAVPATIAHALFGLEVALPVAAGEDAAAAAQRSGASGAGAELDVFTKYVQLVHARALRRALAALGGTDGGACAEDVLCAAEAEAADRTAPSRAHGSGGGGGGGARSAGPPASGGTGTPTSAAQAPAAAPLGGVQPLASLLRLPTVFTLAVVWESPQVEMQTAAPRRGTHTLPGRRSLQPPSNPAHKPTSQRQN